MNLETSNGFEGTATPERIQELIQNEAQRGDYIILSQSDQVYFQTTGVDDEFHAEYRDGGAGQHFVSKCSLSGSELNRLMLRYLKKEPNWQDEHKWQPLG
jgi:hypothetical protein